MVNERYSIAMSETLHYLKGINQDDINKIPNKFILFLKENASNNYSCNFDYTKPLKELKLSKEAKGLIAMICLNYWCRTPEQKQEYLKRLNENERKYQEEVREKYNPDNIFKNKEEIVKTVINESEITETAMTEYKESILKRIVSKIKRIFGVK